MEMSALDCIQEDNIMQLLFLCNNMKNKNNSNNSNNNEMAFLEERDMYGNTALLKACFMGKLQCCRILLSFGADIYALNYFGQNALTLASHSGNLAVIRHLLNYRTYVDFNKSSIVPAICVAALCQHEQLLTFFGSLEEGNQQEDLHTAHGISAELIKEMVQNVNSLAL